MFDIPDEKIFMDSVHGYISVPRCFVRYLIDTDAFQRLRNIDQTGMRTLYPNARHDRFSHSLGVFHLGRKAVDALLENFSQDDYWHIRSDKTRDVFWAKNKVLFLIACLLHDIGHTPFSHSLEQIVLQNSANDELSAKKLCKRLIEEEAWDEDDSGVLKAAPHELIGARYILDHLTDNIEHIFDELIAKNYPAVPSERFLYAEHYSDGVKIDKTELMRDICFIARMIIGYKYTGYAPEKQIRNCFIELLNGSSFDVDKLDYVIRDTKESGISNTNVDVERLLDSLSIITKTRYMGMTFGNPEQGLFENREKLVALQMFGTDGDSLYIRGSFSGTILLKSNTSVSIKNGSTFLSFVPIDHAQIQYEEDQVKMVSFSEATTVVQDAEVINARSSIKPLGLNNGKPFDCKIENATIAENDFNFKVQDTAAPGAAMELKVNGHCDISISGAFKISSPLTFFKAEVCGKIREALFLGNQIPDQVPDYNKYNEFTVGYKKKAINVIANVLEARNYLYLWIYAHHKVMYYANFLIPALACEALRKTSKTSFPVWKLSYEDIDHLDDSYIWTAVKYYYHKNKTKDRPWVRLCQELLTRQYKISLFKSLAEFDVLFGALSDSKKLALKKYFYEHCCTDFPYVCADNISAGYLKADVVKAIKKLGAPEQIKDIVYLDASYKEGKFNADGTFIVMKNEVIPLSAIPLLNLKNTGSVNTANYFYLYYSTDTTDPKELDEEANQLKTAIKEFAERNIREDE